MRVLIVESNPDLGALWKRHLERLGADVELAVDEAGAVHALRMRDFDIIVLDLVIEEGAALAISDFASYRRPEARVIFVTNSSFFSDGSIFQHASNAHACIPDQTPAEDLAALVEYHGKHATELSG